MKLANATNTNRKFGKPRDLQYAPAPAQRSPFRYFSHRIVILSGAPHRLIA
jgi:hypothetical protein